MLENTETEKTTGVEGHGVLSSDGAADNSEHDQPISSETKLNQERQETEDAARVTLPTTTVIENPMQNQEVAQAMAKPTSTHSNTDTTPQPNGTPPPTNSNDPSATQTPKSALKRLSTMIAGLGKSRSLERGEKKSRSLTRHLSMNLWPKKGSLLAAQSSVHTEKPTGLTSATSRVEDTIGQQQSQDPERGFVHVPATMDDTQSDKNSSGFRSTVQLRKSSSSLMGDNVGQRSPLVETETESPDTRIEKLETIVEKHEQEIASLRNLVEQQLRRPVPRISTQSNEKNERKVVLPEAEMTTSPIQERPGGDLVFRKADSISLVEVANLVGELNAQIDQTSSLIMDVLPSREPHSSDKDLEIAWSELHDYLGSWLCDKLQHRSKEPEIDYTVAHVALQAGLVNACSRIINDWNPPFWNDGVVFSHVYSKMVEGEGQVTADTWRALARNYMISSQLEAIKQYLDDVLLKLIGAVGGPLESTETLQQQYNEKVDDIAEKAVVIHKVISQEARSTDLSTFTIPSGADFDPSRMEDTEGNVSPATLVKIVCTVEMGLRGKRRISSRQQSGDGNQLKGGSVTLKAKVVLPATLGENLE